MFHDADGSVLHLTDGGKVRSVMLFDIVDGKLIVIEPNVDDDSDIPF